jgi:hypothetical protein
MRKIVHAPPLGMIGFHSKHTDNVVSIRERLATAAREYMRRPSVTKAEALYDAAYALVLEEGFKRP